MKRSRKYLLTIAAAISVAAILYLTIRPAPVPAELAEVHRGRLRITVDEDGETRVREPYLITAPLAGQLERIALDPGDAVEAGDVLAAIQPAWPELLDPRSEAEARARYRAADARFARGESDFEVARAELEKWERYLRRDEARLRSGNISGPMLEDTRLALRVARGQAKAAESALEVLQFERDVAEAALQFFPPASGEEGGGVGGARLEVRSPIGGVVLRRFLESRATVPAGEHLLEVGDPRDLEIRIDVLSQDAVRIRPGQQMIVERWGGKVDLAATVRLVEPSAFTKVSALGVEEQRVYVYADFTGDRPEDGMGLGDGYRIEARIVVWEKADALIVPAGALFRVDGAWRVFRLTERKAVETPVEIGRNNGIEAEILSGLEEGDRVVLHPGDRIAEGVIVEPRDS